MQGLWLAMILGLTACSPYAYSDQTAALSKASSGFQSAFAANNDAIARETQDANSAKWLAGRPLLMLASCGRRDVQPCHVDELRPVPTLQQAAVPQPTPLRAASPGTAAPSAQAEDICTEAEQTLHRRNVVSPGEGGTEKAQALTAEQAIGALTGYVNGLQAVTAAKDRQEFTAAASKLSAALGAIVGTAGAVAAGPAGAAAGPVVAASGNLLFWFVGEELDHLRWEALRSATFQACRPVHVLTKAVGVVFEEQQEGRVGQLQLALGPRLSVLNRSRNTDDATYTANLASLLSLTDTYNTVRDAKPTAAMAAFATAHNQLVRAILHNEGQSAILLQSLDELETAGEKLRKAATSRSTK